MQQSTPTHYEDRAMQVSLHLGRTLAGRTTIPWGMLWTDKSSVYGPRLWGTSNWPFDMNKYEHLRLTIKDVASGKQLCRVTPVESVIDFTDSEPYLSFDADHLRDELSEGLSMHLCESGTFGVVWEDDGEYADGYEESRQIAERYLRERCFGI